MTLVVFHVLTSFRQQENLSLQNLRCELLVNPKGIDVVQPALSWEFDTGLRGVAQTAYQVLVASTKEKLLRNEADLWNSGKVISNQSIHRLYGGKVLQSRTECFWKIKSWTNKGETAWSEPAFWSMGLLDEKDWNARWIGLDSAFAWDSVSKFARLSARYFRKEFSSSKNIKKATAYIAGLGLYELYMNGQRIGNQVLAPVPTDYSKSVFYNTFDVTASLQKGANAMAAVLGNGRFFTMRQNYKPQKWHNFGYPKMLLQLEIEYVDGSKQKIVSDESWKLTTEGPIRTNNEYDGEEYDATKELVDWNRPGFDDNKWQKVRFVKSPGGVLRAQMTANMKVMETILPKEVRELSSEKFIIDMGQNIAGWIKMKVQGQRGLKVTLRFAETLQNNGELFVANLRDAKVTDVYTLKGGEEEIWEPSFVYPGFRYVELTGYPSVPSLKNFEGRVVYDEMETTGSFETSNATINGIHRNAYWGIRSNYKGMPVDCPQRNERQPWLGDRSTGAYGESFLFDNGTLYTKWLDDIQQAQKETGSIPDVAPNFWYYYKDNMTWPGTYLMIANTIYNQYGNLYPLKKHYPFMRKWLSYMREKYMKNYILAKDSYGDWCVPPESLQMIRSRDSLRTTDGALIGTAYYYYFLSLMQRFANLLDKPAEAKEYAVLSLNIKEAFQKKFYNANTKKYSNNTVTANILPLSFGLVSKDLEKTIFQNIVDKQKENGGHISTGVIGTQWLMRGLSANGRPDLAYQLATNKTYPSWGYMLENGATTIWELWNGNTADPGMNSGNHVMLLGDLMVWFYENLAGIKTDTEKPGFKRIVMNPCLPDSLDFVKASYHSVHGLVKSEWKKEEGGFKWNISIPANTTALVYLPANSPGEITESGKSVSSSEGVRYLRNEGGRQLFEIGSGQYEFVVNNYKNDQKTAQAQNEKL